MFFEQCPRVKNFDCGSKKFSSPNGPKTRFLKKLGGFERKNCSPLCLVHILFPYTCSVSCFSVLLCHTSALCLVMYLIKCHVFSLVFASLAAVHSVALVANVIATSPLLRYLSLCAHLLRSTAHFSFGFMQCLVAPASRAYRFVAYVLSWLARRRRAFTSCRALSSTSLASGRFLRYYRVSLTNFFRVLGIVLPFQLITSLISPARSLDWH